jgi:hypothetical protein
VTKARKPRAPKMLAPCECKRSIEFDALPVREQRVGQFKIFSDGFYVGVRWEKAIDSHVMLIPSAEFKQLIRWYQKKQKVRK